MRKPDKKAPIARPNIFRLRSQECWCDVVEENLKHMTYGHHWASNEKMLRCPDLISSSTACQNLKVFNTSLRTLKNIKNTRSGCFNQWDALHGLFIQHQLQFSSSLYIHFDHCQRWCPVHLAYLRSAQTSPQKSKMCFFPWRIVHVMQQF